MPNQKVQIEVNALASPQDEQLNQIAAMHCSTFPEGILSQLGPTFVREYYANVLESPGGYLWTATIGAEVAGYLACTTERERFERKHRAGRAKRAMSWRLLTLRLSLPSVLRALKKRRLARGAGEGAELLAIAVAPAHRRSGVGRRLVVCWEQVLRADGRDGYVVFTDNEEGYQFYRGVGGECLFRFRLGGRTSAAFRMRVKDR